jgi:hypothetical protein
MTTATKLFKEAASLLPFIDCVLPDAVKNEYVFFSDEWFENWIKSPDATPEQSNYIIAVELVEKAHLASVTALLRAKRWADATCLMYERENFLGWAASVRGLLESAGDTVDGLLQVPKTLAFYHRNIAACLAGKEQVFFGGKELEDLLDHFVHAKWGRGKAGDVLIAKENITYVRTLGSVIPNVEGLYHRLCSICHPSSASLGYFNEGVVQDGARRGVTLSLSPDAAAISALCEEYPNALRDILMMHCNPPLMILKVLHVFKVHPQLKLLREFDLKKIKAGPEIERLLKGGEYRWN